MYNEQYVPISPMSYQTPSTPTYYDLQTMGQMHQIRLQQQVKLITAAMWHQQQANMMHMSIQKTQLDEYEKELDYSKPLLLLTAPPSPSPSTTKLGPKPYPKQPSTVQVN